MCFLWFLVVLFLSVIRVRCVTSGVDHFSHHGRCEPITIPLCLNLPWNETIMPNLLGHQKQEEAGMDAHQYYPLYSINCSPYVKTFLCSLYAPVCTILEKPLPPCRHLCQAVRSGCENLVIQFGFQWPAYFDCDQFPETTADGNSLCFAENTTSIQPTLPGPIGTRKVDLPTVISINGLGHAPDGGKDLGFVCPKQLEVDKGEEFAIQVGGRRVENCGLPCKDFFFTEEKIRLARQWIAVWSFLCVASCLFTVLTFTIDTDRFKYPERPIIFLGVCYLVVGIVYVIGYFFADAVACREENPGHKESLVMQGTKRQMCTFLFMLLYFFNMASSVWWVVLTLTWFLAAGLKWGHEAIEAHSQYFHAAAWGVPALKTIVLLAMASVEGDILSGVCYVGLWNVDALRQFVLAPLAIYLVLGIIFLMAGFVSLFRIRTVMRHDGTKTDKLEKLMLRIGIFSVLYLVPALFVIGCLFYEQNYQEQWLLTWHAEMCPKYQIPCPPRTQVQGKRPDFAVFMVKYFMALVVGITSSVWVWSGKTVVSWTRFFNRIRGKRSQAYV